MPLDPSAVGAASEPRRTTWTRDQSCLYALGVGAGTGELAFTTDNTRGVEQRALATMPVILGNNLRVLKSAGTFDWTKLVHAEQEVQCLAELPPEGEATTSTRIVEMWDKEKAALVVLETAGDDSQDGTPLFRTRTALFIRDAGGWGGDRGPSLSTRVPDREPDETVTWTTRPDQALLYRLSGDHNPLHSDPEFAARAGFDRPILHGLCSFGFAGRAVLHARAGGDPGRIRSIGARFAAPVLPGDDLHIDLWDVEDDVVAFQARRNDTEVVLSAGLAELVVPPQADNSSSG